MGFGGQAAAARQEGPHVHGSELLTAECLVLGPAAIWVDVQELK